MLQIIGKKNLWFTLSGCAMLASLVLVAVIGLRLGIDFTGGTLMEVKFSSSVDAAAVTAALQKAGESVAGTEAAAPAAKSVLSLSNQEGDTGTTTPLPEESGSVEIGIPQIQPIGENHFIVRTKYINDVVHAAIQKEFKALNGGTDAEELRFETIGPTIGETLKKHAYLAIGLASLFMILYIAFAFRKVPRFLSPFRFGVVAVIALLHDVLITVGAYALLGVLFGVEVDSLFVTAMLTVMGFSVHDTIVVFDRIRENVRMRPTEDFAKLANDSVNQTIARSINTSMTTLITLTVLFLLGGESIKWFVFALIVGITVGTYSSIFIASPLLVIWKPKMVGAQTHGHSLREKR